MRGRPEISGTTSSTTTHTMSTPINVAQTGPSHVGKARRKRRKERSSEPGGCAATIPASASNEATRPTMSVARRTRG